MSEPNEERALSLAPRMFDAYQKHRSLERKVKNAIAEIVGDRWSWVYLSYDYYDSSVEFLAADNDATLTPDEQAALFDTLGFRRTWICHKDGSETHYARGGNPEGYKRPVEPPRG